MAGSATMEMAPGQILSDAGAATFRRWLEGGETLRCANLWMALAHAVGRGAIEIEIYCGLDTRTDHWAAEVYYDGFDHAIAALREYERTGNMPEGE